jgi:hypothetical protein
MCTQLVEKECGVKYFVFKKHTAHPVIKFCQRDISIHASFLSCTLGTGLGVLTAMRLCNAVWVRTTCRLVHGYECFRGAFWVCLHRQLED